MGLVTKPKNVQIKEVNQGRVPPTHQQEEPVNLGKPMQEDLKIKRRRPTVRDTLMHGEMKLIKEVLEVPIAQSDVGHIAAHCCTMRCYSCSGLGHKAQDCWSTRKQPLRSFPYSSSRKASTNEGTNAQRTDAKKKVWMRKTE